MLTNQISFTGQNEALKRGVNVCRLFHLHVYMYRCQRKWPKIYGLHGFGARYNVYTYA